MKLNFRNGTLKIEKDTSPKEKSAKPYDVKRFVADLIRKTKSDEIV